MKKSATKQEALEHRKAANKEWKAKSRHIWSGCDPNPRHTLYYQRQLPELALPEEWLRFQDIMSRELPVTLRVCPRRNPAVAQWLHRKFNDPMFNTMVGRFIEFKGEVLQGEVLRPVVSCGKEVYELAVDSTTLAKDEGLTTLSSLIKREVRLGNIVRQELVSMIPAILLNVACDHWVLDVCAAPGSKTEQLLSIMDGDADRRGILSCTGLVLANDADYKRIETLKCRHRCAQSSRLVLTCSRAEDLRRHLERPFFDRILCDVPCSGDGTFRKSPHLWRLFRPRSALELHPIQLQIATSAALLLKPGGRMVYSTCSINPIEDEAVVAGLVKRFYGKLKVVDSLHNELLPGFIFRPGKLSWENSLDVFSVGESSQEGRKETIMRLPELLPSMIAPSVEEAKSLNLEKCLRVLPQDQNTGGFFIAVLELAEDLTQDERCFFNRNSKIDADKSTSVMKNLGYNPKVKKEPKTVGSKRQSCEENQISLEHSDLRREIGSALYDNFDFGPYSSLRMTRDVTIKKKAISDTQRTKTSSGPGDRSYVICELSIVNDAVLEIVKSLEFSSDIIFQTGVSSFIRDHGGKWELVVDSSSFLSKVVKDNCIILVDRDSFLNILRVVLDRLREGDECIDLDALNLSLEVSDRISKCFLGLSKFFLIALNINTPTTQELSSLAESAINNKFVIRGKARLSKAQRKAMKVSGKPLQHSIVRVEDEKYIFSGAVDGSEPFPSILTSNVLVEMITDRSMRVCMSFDCLESIFESLSV